MLTRTPQEVQREEIESLIQEVLADQYIEVELQSVKVSEEAKVIGTNTALVLTRSDQPKKIRCKADGNGMVHSLFLCLKEIFAEEFVSLSKINLYSFAVNTRLDTALTKEKTDARVEVLVEFENAFGAVVPFRAASTSLLKATLDTLIAAVQLYINAELAFVRIKSLITEAEVRNRYDVRADLIYKITKIVGVSSYEEIAG